jgi:hypothetical protein
MRLRRGSGMAKPRKDPRAILLKNVEKDAEILRGLNSGSKKTRKEVKVAVSEN